MIRSRETLVLLLLAATLVGSAASTSTTEAPTNTQVSSSTGKSTRSSGSASLDFIDSTSLSLSYTLAKASEATSTITSTYRNWVGARSVSADSACYREAHIMDVCPSNFDRNAATNTCWTECPIDYPVECGMECIRQNDDCTLEIVNKVAAVANTALSIASVGVSKNLWQIAKGVKTAIDCANLMIGIVRAIIRYVRNIKTSNPQTSHDKILALLYQTNNVVTDLPIAIYACMGLNVPTSLDIWASAGHVRVDPAQRHRLRRRDRVELGQVQGFPHSANFTEATNAINDTEIATLSDALKSNSTCGFDLKSLTDRTWMTVAQFRADNPDITEDELRLKVEESQLVSDIGIVTNNCMEQLIQESDETTAYTTRDTIRKAFSGIINDLVSTGKSDNGSSETAKEFTYKAFDKAFTSIAVTGFDLTGISGMLAEYLQTICGPTRFIGEVDDGTDTATLGLNTIQDAFNGSSSSWTRVGDGQVIIHFSSSDTKERDKIDEVAVAAGGTATWVSNTTALGGKTLYLDRWRPGLFGLPGTGGGSLLLWVPKASQGGHLELQAKLNVS
ncbi:hypothetical protein PHYSODRAFT_249540 [Phytophthora sojae]|uniref:Uncharacterized protein n=1 Tax=Phytophthora sojae (strain P6497) TaxID=1094619 RepID=G4Z754_PHYSP|nr:hypothetical protein PHYSODRAFT_249540 [Phytophthora sojae]EGZ22438.1 hypothetical protein PHYSODRAFT_249540 [Phytophthora sojae]|eukprot:XP_009525155.1 hypothetical protein PHYSODRAFT_249540 [Phytophthora sojae]